LKKSLKVSLKVFLFHFQLLAMTRTHMFSSSKSLAAGGQKNYLEPDALGCFTRRESDGTIHA
jgi:hypothetical protein